MAELGKQADGQAAETSPDGAFEAVLRSLAPPGVLIGHRTIVARDEEALCPVELKGLRGSALGVRRQSGAARIVARALLAHMGCEASAIPNTPSGAPQWPPGIVGSLTHDEHIAVAAVARSSDFEALGIDLEPCAPLPRDLVDVVATPRERGLFEARLLESRLLFALKEATFKALNPLDGVFLEFHDIEIDLDAGRVWTRHGQSLAVAYRLDPYVFALAVKPAGPVSAS